MPEDTTLDLMARAIFDVRQGQGEVLARSWNDAPEEVLDAHREMARAARDAYVTELCRELLRT